MEQTLELGPDSQVDGPVELCSQDLALVGGGLPRGNWLGTEQVPSLTTELSLPRGNWIA